MPEGTIVFKDMIIKLLMGLSLGPGLIANATQMETVQSNRVNLLRQRPEAPFSGERGPSQVQSGEYRFPAELDPLVLVQGPTEVWAQAYWPVELATPGLVKAYPLILFLHGNHGTCGFGSNPRRDNSCEYTETGSCPDGKVVTPNHLGYGYLAENLASWGYLVVSINANRGITCGWGDHDDIGLNLARGRLILKHLALLNDWNSFGNVPNSLGLGSNGLIQKIDFLNVGLMGHSRGGEGARAALNLYRDKDSPWPAKIPQLNIQAIFEIGAVDGQTSRVLDAEGVAWNQLLPMCDGDVYDLQGRRPFERMLNLRNESRKTQKSLFMVAGANHNFYNTEWQVSDSDSEICPGQTIIFPPEMGSQEQRLTALASLPGFFRSQVGDHRQIELNHTFNPLFNVTSVVTGFTPIQREFVSSLDSDVVQHFEDFNQPTGYNSSGNINNAAGVNINHLTEGFGGPVDSPYANLAWEASKLPAYFQSNWTPTGAGHDISHLDSLDFRIAQTQKGVALPNIKVSLVDAEGSQSTQVFLGDYISLQLPESEQILYSTVKIPLLDFAENGNLHRVRSVLFEIPSQSNGSINLARIWFSKGLGYRALASSGFVPVAKNELVKLGNRSLAKSNQIVFHGKIVGRKILKSSWRLHHQKGVEIEVVSNEPFPPLNALPILSIGSFQIQLSHYPDPSDLRKIAFTFEYKSLPKLRPGDAVTLQYGRGVTKRWDLGQF